MIRKELGFSRSEWKELSWIDSQMYSEQLAIHMYEKSAQAWDDTPQKYRKGPRPKPPVFNYEAEENSNPPLGDIEDIMDVNAE